MSWTVLVSSKEKGAQQLVDRLVGQGWAAERRDLEVCDVAFELSGRTYIQAEIKTLADMLASISDSRYHEQSAAMAESCVPYTFYLIRGSKTPDLTEQERVKLEHSMTRVQLSGSLNSTEKNRAHIATVYLTSEDAVFGWINYVRKVLVDDPSVCDGVTAPLSQNVRHTYGTKPGNRDQARVHVEQVSRISHIGEEKAKALGQAYPSMTELLTFLKATPDQATLLSSLKTLRLGKNGVRSLYEQLLRPCERPWEWKEEQKRPRKRTKQEPETDIDFYRSLCQRYAISD